MSEIPRTFNIQRNENIVAYGCIFPSGKVAVNWAGYCSSVVVWDSLDDLIEVNGTNNTIFCFIKEEKIETQ